MVLLEGISDRGALEVLAAARGRDLAGEGVALLAMNGATNVGHFLGRYGPPGLGLRLAGLYDAGAEGRFRRALERAGLGGGLTRAALEGLGFFACTADLEDELIRAVGTVTVERIMEDEGDLRSFRIMQRQPAQRGRRLEDQIHRFIACGSTRKHRYARRLAAAAVELGSVPRPLDGVLAAV